jgi:hypothetical protein
LPQSPTLRPADLAPDLGSNPHVARRHPRTHSAPRSLSCISVDRCHAWSALRRHTLRPAPAWRALRPSTKYDLQKPRTSCINFLGFIECCPPAAEIQNPARVLRPPSSRSRPRATRQCPRAPRSPPRPDSPPPDPIKSRPAISALSVSVVSVSSVVQISGCNHPPIAFLAGRFASLSSSPSQSEPRSKSCTAQRSALATDH